MPAPGVHHFGRLALALGALGVVYGDIGTSPLYALKTVFTIDNGAVKPTQSDVYGVLSMVFWSVTLVVSIKYIAFILRADNDREGGVMALAALVRKSLSGSRGLVGIALLLGVLGASLFAGDSVITPAISVMSAVEGLEVTSPGIAHWVLPISVGILTVLFLAQRFGTHLVGRAFGPIMLLWFGVLAALGIPQIAKHPAILKSLSPTYIYEFVIDHPFTAFIAGGAVVLAITGAEALYADMGHFGRAPISKAWFALVFPALMLNYLGQGALILDRPETVEDPFFLIAPHWSRVPLVILATLATIIASQAVISGAYSVAQQAIRLGYLPNLTVRHTSMREKGQIYVPGVNWLLYASVLIVILAFRSSEKLATAYGLAVTGTFLVSTTLFLIVAATVWGWTRWKLITFGVIFYAVELLYFGANITKVAHGGWLPLLIAAIVVTTMVVWQRGRRVVTRRRKDLEGPLQQFVDTLHEKGLPRVPGTAVFPHPTKDTTPLALRANVEFNQVLHEHVVLVSVRVLDVPYVGEDDRYEVDVLTYTDDGIVHVGLNFGFQDEQDIPGALARIRDSSVELDYDADNVQYFVSRLSLVKSDLPGMGMWEKRIFIGLAHNAADPSYRFHLPPERTIAMGAVLEF